MFTGGVPLHAQREWFEELVDLGYTDVWSAEANGAEAAVNDVPPRAQDAPAEEKQEEKTSSRPSGRRPDPSTEERASLG